MKKPITILAVLLLLSTTAFAAEYPSQVSYSMNNGIFEVRKTYELPVDQEPSMQAKQSFEQDGYSFTLTDLLRQEHTSDLSYLDWDGETATFELAED